MFKTVFTTGIITFDKSRFEWGKNQRLSAIRSKNVYVDLDGTLRPKQFPKEGLWYYDGQVFYLPKEPVAI